MFNWSKEQSKPSKTGTGTEAQSLNQRQALKELEAEVPEIRLKLLTEPEEATPACKNILARLYELDIKVGPGQWNEKEQHKRDVLEMSLLNFLGQTLTDNAYWKEAAETYERCLSLGTRLQLPDFQVASLINLGKAYRHAGQLHQAGESFEKAAQVCQANDLFSQQAEALYQQAVVAELQNQPQVARQAYQQGLELSESERLYGLAVRFLSQLGQLQQGLGEYSAAIEYYDRCLKFLRETDNDKESETIILGQISHICAQIDDFERGIQAAQEGLDFSRQTRQTAEEAVFLADLARLYLGQGDLNQARHYAHMAHLLAQHRKDAQALRETEQLIKQLERGTGELEIEEVPATYRTLSDVIAIPEVHYQRGNVYYREGAFDRAIAAYSRAINLNPKFAAAYINRGSVYTARGDYDRALADYNRAIEFEPKDLVARFNRGNVYRKRREYLPALVDYTEAIRLDPTDPDAYFNRGEVFRRMKRNAEAALDFKQVIKLSAGRDEIGASQARRLLVEMGLK